MTYTCSDSNFTQDFLIDGLGLGYQDFEKGQTSDVLPEGLAVPNCEGWCYEGAVTQAALCKEDFKRIVSKEKDLPETKSKCLIIANFM